MKTQKRSQTNRAFSKGYQAGVSGKSWGNCPFESGETRENWMAGWRDGREDNWNGFGRAAQAQRLSNM
jgi:ribosome modulation factor